MKSYRWAENTSPKDGAKRLEKVYKKDDELPDALRYALMTWPRLPVTKTDPNPPRDISHFSQDMQRVILRERAHDARLKEEDESMIQSTTADDFWG